jgi:DNA replication initiation complex subunit (GINS family)
VIDSGFYEQVVAYLKELKDSHEEKVNYILKVHLDILASIYDKDPTLLSNEQI